LIDEASTICFLSIIFHIAVAAHQISAALLLDDVPQAREKRLSKKWKRLLSHISMKLPNRYSTNLGNGSDAKVATFSSDKVSLQTG
jgi:hypothetical protein